MSPNNPTPGRDLGAQLPSLRSLAAARWGIPREPTALPGAQGLPGCLRVSSPRRKQLGTIRKREEGSWGGGGVCTVAEEGLMEPLEKDSLTQG